MTGTNHLAPAWEAHPRDDYAGCLDTLAERGVLPESLCAFVSGSIVRGWGNPSSDLDFYVVTEDQWDGPMTVAAHVTLTPDSVPTQIEHVEGQRWDIEYWTGDQVRQCIDKVSWQEFENNVSAGNLLTMHEMDLLERIEYGIALSGGEWLESTRSALAESAIRSILAANDLQVCDVLVEDAVGQMDAGDIESAVLSSKMAFGRAIDALLAHHGELGHSAKWRARRFRNSKQEVVSWGEYWDVETMRQFHDGPPQEWIESVLLLCRRISFEIVL
jgi:hypothetical protein